MSHPTRSIRRPPLAVVAATAAALAACSAQAATPSTAPSSQPAGGGGAGGPGGNGAFGQVAAISGTTLQVQDPRNGQTAVTYTASTIFRQTSKVPRSALKVGECVAVQQPATTGTSTGSTVTAGKVTITTATATGCSRAGGGFRGTNG